MQKKKTDKEAEEKRQLGKTELLEIVSELIQEGKENKDSIDETELADAFRGYDIPEEQFEHIRKYIEESGIEINPVLSDSMLSQIESGEEDGEMEALSSEEEFPDEEEERLDLESLSLLTGIETDDPVRFYLKEIGYGKRNNPGNDKIPAWFFASKGRKWLVKKECWIQ